MSVTPEIRAQLKEVNGVKGERFVRSYDRARSRLDRITGRGLIVMAGAIREFRKEILDRLRFVTGAATDPFTLQIVPQVTAEIQRAIGQLSREANASVGPLLENAFDLGAQVTTNAFRAAGVQFAFPSISPDILASITATTESVLTEMSSRLADRLLMEVRLGALGLEPTSAVIERIANQLRTSTLVRPGFRRRINFGAQAEAITRTELGRVFSNAQQAASERIAESVPGLKKRWVTTLRDRRGHREAEDRYAVGGEIGPIPVNRRFRVTDFSRSDFNRDGFWTVRTLAGAQRVFRGKPRRRFGRPITDLLLFPRDPAGSPGNLISCTCVVLEMPGELEQVAGRALGILQQ